MYYGFQVRDIKIGKETMCRLFYDVVFTSFSIDSHSTKTKCVQCHCVLLTISMTLVSVITSLEIHLTREWTMKTTSTMNLPNENIMTADNR